MNFKHHDLTTSKSLLPNPSSPSISQHPIFTPVSVMTHATLLEMDYNLHKSNSTYFADFDISRTALVTDIYTPGFELTKRELDSETHAETGKKKFPGRMAVMLGSVYCSFKKEIPIYERYEMQSKVAAWDEKWLYVLTFFLRPATKKEKMRAGDEKQKKTLLAVGISQYVVKKGRLTVRPARMLRASGLLPPRPDGEGSSSSDGTPAVASTPAVVAETETPASDAIHAGQGLDEGAVLREVMTLTEKTDLSKEVLENERKKKLANMAASWEGTEWSWERIEEERLRGLEIVKSFVTVDKLLPGEVMLH
ncbi:hypothetical protein AJ80_07194 [Polytolypa hystricis UAMH7299]|uniref:Thioesterase n=1 Tax=Polytolypa hystricis (strain UAMH7299) TaxID=1447883 RepID=A0A2B7XHT9_POLH7|nr:hypothetical protein AJ80_07194 [Polytolypa hystricis UAMH7299]